jgi:periplasmic protein TonB
VQVKQLKTNKMKRNEEKVPGFDEIIFEDRNREYGAYDLRRRSKSVTSFSILGAIAFCIVLVAVLSFTTKNGTASSGSEIIVIAQLDNYNPEIIKPPEIKPPPELIKATQNIAPEVVTDTFGLTSFIPTTEEITSTATNGDVNDSIIYSETPEEIVPSEPKVFIVVEEMPEFPGGNEALLDYIRKNTVYPAEAAENNIGGRVTLKFIVNTDGSVGRIEVLKNVDPLLDQEAIRVVSTLPKFRPGKQGGKPVQVWYTVPVLFKINVQ